MELTTEAFDRVVSLFKLPVDVDGMPFVVVAGDEPIFLGAFYTPASSISYDGLAIIHPLSEDSHSLPFVLGFSVVEAFEGSDPRSDAQIIARLRAVGKIR
jgi:hypothetical protein